MLLVQTFSCRLEAALCINYRLYLALSAGFWAMWRGVPDHGDAYHSPAEAGHGMSILALPPTLLQCFPKSAQAFRMFESCIPLTEDL
jgi:hypothetical protein